MSLLFKIVGLLIDIQDDINECLFIAVIQNGMNVLGYCRAKYNSQFVFSNFSSVVFVLVLHRGNVIFDQAICCLGYKMKKCSFYIGLK